MFQHIGQEMGISGIFDSYEGAEQYMLNYEDQHMHFSPKNATVAEASVAVALKLLPQCVHGMIRQVLYTLCGPKLRTAMVSE